MDERPNGRPATPRPVDGEWLVRREAPCEARRAGSAQRAMRPTTGGAPALAAALAAALSVAAE
jgi:hypothetical protein